jgi:hypothetical protein
MKWRWLFLPISLWATVNEPLRCKLLSGYRNDHIHWHSGDLFEEFKDVQFWENDLSLKVIHRDLTFYAKGGGSAFGQGQGEGSSTHGWAIDGTGYFGYAVNLTAERLYMVAATPLAGFSGHYEKINAYRQVWYGPNIGASIYINPGRSISFEVGYAYHWLFLRLHTEKIKTKEGGNHGQSGWAELEWQASRLWRLGAAGTIEYYFSNENLKLHFTSISVLVTISRQL